MGLFVLVFWEKARNTSVLPASLIPGCSKNFPDVGRIVNMPYEKKSYRAKIIKYSEDAQFLSQLDVSTDGKLMAMKGKSKKGTKGSEALKALVLTGLEEELLQEKHCRNLNEKKKFSDERETQWQEVTAKRKKKKKDDDANSSSAYTGLRECDAMQISDSESLLSDVPLLNSEKEVEIESEARKSKVFGNSEKKLLHEDCWSSDENEKPNPDPESQSREVTLKRKKKKKNTDSARNFDMHMKLHESCIKTGKGKRTSKAPKSKFSMGLWTTTSFNEEEWSKDESQPQHWSHPRQASDSDGCMSFQDNVNDNNSGSFSMHVLPPNSAKSSSDTINQGLQISPKQKHVKKESASSPKLRIKKRRHHIVPKVQVEIQDGSGVYVDSQDLRLIKRWVHKPNEMVRRLMLNLVGEENLKHMTARGMVTCPGKAGTTKNFQGVPVHILDSVKHFIDTHGLYKLDKAEYHRVINQQCHALRNPAKKRNVAVEPMTSETE